MALIQPRFQRTRHPSPGNLILKALPHADRDLLLDRMEALQVPAGQHLAEPGRPMDRVYFPVSGLVSLATTLPDGACVEVAMLGREGLIGVPIVLGGDSWPNVRVTQQIEGRSLVIDADAFREELARSRRIRDAIDGYLRALLGQAAQEIACNRMHQVDERFSRWLLIVRDRLEMDRFPATQELFAEVLGVRRASISIAAGALRAGGAIDYHRGHIRIVDAELLEERACECYRVIRREFERSIA